MPANLDFSKISLMDALDLAILVEAEAGERYQLFAKQIGHRFAGDSASIFHFMAENEAKHGRQLYARRHELFGETPMNVKKDDVFDVEAPEVGAVSWSMSPLKACQVALAAEEKAHDFFDSALEHVTDKSVRELFSELRAEEIEHVDLIKAAMKNLPPGSDEDLENEDE